MYAPRSSRGCCRRSSFFQVAAVDCRQKCSFVLSPWGRTGCSEGPQENRSDTSSSFIDGLPWSGFAMWEAAWPCYGQAESAKVEEGTRSIAALRTGCSEMGYFSKAPEGRSTSCCSICTPSIWAAWLFNAGAEKAIRSRRRISKAGTLPNDVVSLAFAR